jgi:formylglycine-generating enzyme required for sulfatase activity
MLASLDHPEIVKVLRSFHAFGTAYFVMPFVEGMALDELAKKRGDRSFTEEELVSLLKETLSALGYLHDRGIYHRDIKPGNILITDQGKPVLIDFGSARQRLSERSMTVVESAGYTPFEQLQSRGNVGPWSDLYALAATMVKVMTGEAPPKANDRGFGDSWQPLSGRAELTRRFSPLLLGTLDRGLKLPIEERWQNAGDWQNALKSGEVPVVADATNKKELSDEEEVVRKKHAWPKVAAALLVFGIAGAWWFTNSTNNASPVQVVSEPKSGGLVITSEPSGAEVMQGDKVLGKTPLELTGLLADSRWEGRLKKEDYEVAQISAEVISGETKIVPQIVLIPKPQKVIVTSEPSGAEVLEGDKALGVTPWEGRPRTVGEKVEFSLRKDGYERVKLQGEVECGKTLQMDVKLIPAPQTIFVTSEPSGAMVMQGGKQVGKTPWEAPAIAPGSKVEIVLRKAGYEDVTLSGAIELGKALVLRGKLQPMPQKVIVTSEPSGAMVMQGGKQVGKTPWEAPAIVPGSKVEIVLRKAGYEERVLSGEVITDETLVLRTKLKILPIAGTKAGEQRDFEISGGVKMAFCWCPAGEFVMGSPSSETSRDSDENQVKVILTKGFWMAKTEVTHAQWQAVMGSNSSGVKGDEPVGLVSWEDTQIFLAKLNTLIGIEDGGRMALPSEAQWEYACRAGEIGPYSGGPIDQVAWYKYNSNSAHAVGTTKANLWGLHDMHGNVWEWCDDMHNTKLYGGVDPRGAPERYRAFTGRVLRGGSWAQYANSCRAANREFESEYIKGYNIGFRVARISGP